MQISRELLDELRAIVAGDPAHEVCGLLLGRDGIIEAIREAANVAEDKATRFEIDPRVLISTARDSRNGGLPVIGCYHSHPGGIAAPSRTDFALAEPGSLWLIFAVDDVTLWQRGATQFQRLSLDVR